MFNTYKYNTFLLDLEFLPEDVSPTDFTVSNVDVTTVDLAWTVSPILCDVLGYEIVMTTSGQETTIFLEGGTTSVYQAAELRVNTVYSFTIAARTVLVGDLPASAPVTARTLNFTGMFLNTLTCFGNINYL